MRRGIGVVLALVGTLSANAIASDGDRYAWQWPLTLTAPEAALWQVPLSAEVYEAAMDPGLADLDVVDASGAPVPAAVIGAPAAADGDELRVELPWFALPPPSPSAAPRWRVRTETGPDRRVQRVETELLEGAGELPALTGLLLDASAIDATIVAIELHWPPRSEPLDARYRLEYSDDLDRWQLAREARLVDLHNAGQRIVQSRLATGAGASARYFRLQPIDSGSPLELERVDALIARGPVEAEPTWLALDGRRSESDGRVVVEFDNPGRFPVDRVDIVVGANATGEWWLESRDSEDQAWQRRLPPALAYRLVDADGGLQSPPRLLGRVHRDRHWRVLVFAPNRDSPTLRLGYRPETLVFLAQGEAPFALVAGSAQARRAPAPVAAVLAQQQARHGEAWQPATARLGSRADRDGAAALTPPAPTRDWTGWVLWAVLLLAALAVSGMALSVLRRS